MATATASAPETEPVVPPTRLSWQVMTAALIALGTMSLTGRGTIPFSALYAIGLVATAFSSYRMDNATPLRWILRVAQIGVAYAFTHLTNPGVADYLIGPAWMRNFFALVFAGEMVLQAWRARADNPRAPLLVVFLSGFVFLTACNTFDDHFIRFITPIYMLALALGLRTYRQHTADSPMIVGASQNNRPQRRPFSVAGAHGIALTLALLIGFTNYRIFQHYRGEITDWGNNILGQRLEDMDNSGMSDQPSLGRMFGLRGFPERILRLSGNKGSGGYTGDPHLRGMSFDTYDSGRWGPAISQRSYTPPPDPDLRVRRSINADPTGTTSIIRVTRMVRGNPLIYAPLNASEIDLTDADNLQWSPTTSGPIRTPTAPPFIYILTIPERENYQGVLMHKITMEERQKCLDIPASLNRQVITLAHSIAGPKKTPQQKIDAVVDYLISHHHYSLTVDPGPGDPVSGFLISDPPKDAHCEYFAASAALLLRCVGVPTRYVTGYYAHENDGQDTTIVRQRDAHAWTEAWINNVGWVTVDATPGDGRPDYKPDPISKWQSFWERIQDINQAVKDWLGDLKPEQVNLIVGSMTGITVGGGGIWLFLRRRRGGAIELVPAFAYTIPSEELASIAERFDRELSRRGVPRPEASTWQEHLIRIEDTPTLASFLPLANRFVPLYERTRYGVPRGEAAIDALSTLKELLADMEAQPVPRSLTLNKGISSLTQ